MRRCRAGVSASRGDGVVAPEVRVFDQVMMRVECRDLGNNYLDAAASRYFQRWDEVGVVGHDDDPIDVLVQGKSRNVDADAHIDAFLFETKLVVIGTRSA